MSVTYPAIANTDTVTMYFDASPLLVDPLSQAATTISGNASVSSLSPDDVMTINIIATIPSGVVFSASGGTVGAKYNAVLTFSTSSGDTLNRTIIVPVKAAI